MEFLNRIRTPEKPVPVKKQIFITIGILLFGIFMGVFSKFLDHRQAELQGFLQVIDSAVDLHNFLGEFGPWILIAVLISVYSISPLWSAVRVFLFFAGMVSSYYLYCHYVAGFFPRSYAMIWVGFTFLSPFLAWVCWYARGKGGFAFLLSSGIISVLINTTFVYGMFYLHLRGSILNLLVLAGGIAALYQSFRQILWTVGAGIAFAVLLWMTPFFLF